MVGISKSFRPGLPSISRMLEDQSSWLPAIYISFVLFTYVGRTLDIILNEINTNKKILKIDLGFTFLQALFLLLIPSADLDHALTFHMVVAGSIVAVTLFRELIYVSLSFAKNSNTNKDQKYRFSKTKCKTWFHLSFIICILSFAMAFLILSLIVAHIEVTSPFAILEYVLFMLIATVNIFNPIVLH
jgi:hypothetical protein